MDFSTTFPSGPQSNSTRSGGQSLLEEHLAGKAGRVVVARDGIVPPASNSLHLGWPSAQ
ncbi:MAG: hypothetical protein V1875_05035 [Candidatus Altiarchaeota archaeon]